MILSAPRQGKIICSFRSEDYKIVCHQRWHVAEVLENQSENKGDATELDYTADRQNLQ